MSNTRVISDFILARIAEDEAEDQPTTPFSIDTRPEDNFDMASFAREVDRETDSDSKYPLSRVLAECAAKRAIVAACEMAGDVDESAASLRREILHATASIYENHPEYDQAWGAPVWS